MTSTLLHAVARKAEAQTPDADLLARFARDRDHPAFEELGRRHGPLVWAVCRHLLPEHADAEDAFQAVFLSLVRSAASIRDGRAVPAWLHGVAVRAAARVRRGCARRRKREERVAVAEAARPVSDGAWEGLIAAVHEEVQRLPDAERTAFVLCDLEGVSQPDAATRLGWPLGSLSGRLCKARQRLVEQLNARGIAPAAAVGVGLTAGVAGAVPATLFEVVKVFPASPATASTAAAALARGLTEGVTMKLKLVTAALVVAAGFGATGGAVLLSNAEAQQEKPAPAAPPLAGGSKAPQPGVLPPAASGPLGGAPGMAPPGAGAPAGFAPAAGGMGGLAFAAPTWEYKFVEPKSPFANPKDDRLAFETTVTKYGKEGWEYVSSEQFKNGDKPEYILVFKKAKGGSATFTAPAVGGQRGGAAGFGTTGGAGFGSGPGLSATIPAAPDDFEVFKLKNSVAEEVASKLGELFGGRELRLVVDKASNSLIIASAPPAMIKDIARLIEEMDAKAPRSGGPGPAASTTSTGGGTSTSTTARPEARKPAAYNVFSLKNANAPDMLAVLKQLFPNADMTADPRTNALVVRADEKTLEDLRALVAKLDVEVVKSK